MEKSQSYLQAFLDAPDGARPVVSKRLAFTSHRCWDGGH